MNKFSKRFGRGGVYPHERPPETGRFESQMRENCIILPVSGRIVMPSGISVKPRKEWLPWGKKVMPLTLMLATGKDGFASLLRSNLYLLKISRKADFWKDRTALSFAVLSGRQTCEAYLPNPGKLWELLLPGRTLYLIENSHNRGIKFPYLCVAVERGRHTGPAAYPLDQSGRGSVD